MADTFTKQGSKRDALGEIMDYNKFKHAQAQDSLVIFENDEFKVRNLVTKKSNQQN